MNPPRHYLQFKDFFAAEYDYLFERVRRIKEKFKRYEPYHPLFDRSLVMIFEKASTRTSPVFRSRHAATRRRRDLPEYPRLAAGAVSLSKTLPR